MPVCCLCQTDAAAVRLDLGPQPISNRYLAATNAEEALFPLVLAQCEACGLIRLSQAPPAEEVRPRHPWISYSEPESHLDELARVIAHLPGLTSAARVWGVSSKDDSLLRRLERLGYRETYRLDAARDLDIQEPAAGMETIQARLDGPRAQAIRAVHGPADVIIARHIVEHAHDLRGFVAALLALLRPAGFLVLEVPDCHTGFTLGDCTVIWEEHRAYFTPATFPLLFGFSGLQLADFRVFPNGPERLLVAIGRALPDPDARAVPASASQEHGLLREFGRRLDERRRHAVGLLAEYGDRRRRVAVLGAGHMACVFLSLLGLRHGISLVVDNDPHKQGLLMPGSHLPIREPEALLREEIDLCLLSVNPEAEERVVEGHRAFLERGGEFASIFAASDRSWL